jgi:stage V sporulation protein G
MSDKNTTSHSNQEDGKMPARDVKLDVRVYPIDDPERSTQAFASITVDDLIAIRGIRVVQGEEGLFVSMPQSRQEKDGETKYHDIAFPVMPGLRKQIRQAVLDGYKAELDKSADKSLDAELRKGKKRAAGQVAGQSDGGTKNRFDGARG